MERYEEVKATGKHIFLNNFLGGFAWALGATIGLAIIFMLLGLIIKNVNLVPFVGNFIADVINFVISKNPNLVK